jgi:hypothetical protein
MVGIRQRATYFIVPDTAFIAKHWLSGITYWPVRASTADVKRLSKKTAWR